MRSMEKVGDHMNHCPPPIMHLKSHFKKAGTINQSININPNHASSLKQSKSSYSGPTWIMSHIQRSSFNSSTPPKPNMA